MPVITWKPINQANLGDVLLTNNRSELAVIVSKERVDASQINITAITQSQWDEHTGWSVPWSDNKNKFSTPRNFVQPFLDLSQLITVPADTVKPGDVIVYKNSPLEQCSGKVHTKTLVFANSINPRSFVEFSLMDSGRYKQFEAYIQEQVAVLTPASVPPQIKRLREVNPGEVIYNGDLGKTFSLVESIQPKNRPDWVRLKLSDHNGLSMHLDTYVELLPTERPAKRGHLHTELWF